MKKYTKEQQKENRKLWIETLKSGKYDQGSGYLHKENKFCCLGVLCELIPDIKKDWNACPRSISKITAYGEKLKDTMAPLEAMEFVGLNTEKGNYWDRELGTTLTHKNDSGYDFEQIAKIIESEPKGLFND